MSANCGRDKELSTLWLKLIAKVSWRLTFHFLSGFHAVLYFLFHHFVWLLKLMPCYFRLYEKNFLRYIIGLLSFIFLRHFFVTNWTYYLSYHTTNQTNVKLNPLGISLILQLSVCQLWFRSNLSFGTVNCICWCGFGKFLSHRYFSSRKKNWEMLFEALGIFFQ